MMESITFFGGACCSCGAEGSSRQKCSSSTHDTSSLPVCIALQLHEEQLPLILPYCDCPAPYVLQLLHLDGMQLGSKVWLVKVM